MQGSLSAARKVTVEEYHSLGLAIVMPSAVVVEIAAMTSNTSAPVSSCPNTYFYNFMCVFHSFSHAMDLIDL